MNASDGGDGRRFDRREFIKRLGTTSAVVGALGLVLWPVACGGDDDDDDDDGTTACYKDYCDEGYADGYCDYRDWGDGC